MKPTNPMAQLEQWKANHRQNKINWFVSEMNERKIEPVKNAAALKIEDTPKTQQETQGATKGKHKGKLPLNPLALKLAQFNRQFDLIKQSNQLCVEKYPDCFHHKLKLSAECADLIERLNNGRALLKALSTGVTLTQEQTALLKSFNQAHSYLVFKLGEVVDDVKANQITLIEQTKINDGKGGNDE
ncbi:hypothetical protein BKL49_10850 [Rodentibacter myodis]|uniref:Uncharacterized protein n=2 Tax=Rodentibacter myodis TaxID=1907939 RepID=A0A1V3JGV0_9PAST|nr:hypothetical protein [Rodentibacter myodis]OOF56031.1 hypothetical protein BKL49_10850 [Rodentibacter myodis]